MQDAGQDNGEFVSPSGASTEPQRHPQTVYGVPIETWNAWSPTEQQNHIERYELQLLQWDASVRSDIITLCARMHGQAQTSLVMHSQQFMDAMFPSAVDNVSRMSAEQFMTILRTQTDSFPPRAGRTGQSDDEQDSYTAAQQENNHAAANPPTSQSTPFLLLLPNAVSAAVFQRGEMSLATQLVSNFASDGNLVDEISRISYGNDSNLWQALRGALADDVNLLQALDNLATPPLSRRASGTASQQSSSANQAAGAVAAASSQDENATATDVNGGNGAQERKRRRRQQTSLDSIVEETEGFAAAGTASTTTTTTQSNTPPLVQLAQPTQASIAQQQRTMRESRSSDFGSAHS